MHVCTLCGVSMHPQIICVPMWVNMHIYVYAIACLLTGDHAHTCGCVCMPMCTRPSMNICICKDICVYMYVFMCIYFCPECAHRHGCVCILLHIYLCVNVCLYIAMHVCTYLHACINAHGSYSGVLSDNN